MRNRRVNTEHANTNEFAKVQTRIRNNNVYGIKINWKTMYAEIIFFFFAVCLASSPFDSHKRIIDIRLAVGYSFL